MGFATTSNPQSRPAPLGRGKYVADHKILFVHCRHTFVLASPRRGLWPCFEDPERLLKADADPHPKQARRTSVSLSILHHAIRNQFSSFAGRHSACLTKEKPRLFPLSGSVPLLYSRFALNQDMIYPKDGYHFTLDELRGNHTALALEIHGTPSCPAWRQPQEIRPGWLSMGWFYQFHSNCFPFLHCGPRCRGV